MNTYVASCTVSEFQIYEIVKSANVFAAMDEGTDSMASLSKGRSSQRTSRLSSNRFSQQVNLHALSSHFHTSGKL